MTHLTRRTVLAGLVIGAAIPGLGRAQSGAAAMIKGEAGEAAFAPNAFVRVAPDGTVTVIVKHIEFGQGPYTGLATLVAEEMDADWSQMRAEAAPANVELYVNSAFGIQGTGGSTAMKSSYDIMRKAGAAARALLVEAAAEAWGVPAAEVTVAKGRIRHEASGQEGGFGDFAEAAARLTPPEEPTLKDPADFTLIGTTLTRLDTPAKTTGEALFGIDIQDDDMLVAAILHPPAFGATLRSFDATEALAVPGVVDVKEVPQGIAVYARTTYPAIKARELVRAEWDESAAETRSTAEMLKTWAEAAEQPGTEAEARGDVEAALADAATVHEATYSFPFLAHAPMEPIDGVIRIGPDGALAQMGSQLQTVDKNTIAGVLGIEAGKVQIETLLAGGSFGRRAQPTSSMAAEIAAVGQASGHGGPVKLVWTRENDIKGGWYRPLTVHRMRGGLDAGGELVAWDNIIATPSIMAGTPFEAMIEGGVDPSSVEGSKGLPYTIPNFRVSLHDMETKVPVLWWRSVGHTHTAYATECFLDELLEKAGRDPVEGRLAMLADHARHHAVLERVAQMADWQGRTGSGGSAFGVAVHKSFESYIAQVAEVRDEGGFPRVVRVWCAVDCGVAVNPDVIAAQMEGGIGFGLGAVLFDAITLGQGGRVEQSNFHDYRMIRINEMPEVEVSLIESTEHPTGVGEPGVPPIGPAVANAWRALTGRAVRDLPFLNQPAA